jgi:predicted nucleic acid-binding protein
VIEWRVRRGLVGLSVATELELGFSAQSVEGCRTMRKTLVDQLIRVGLPLRAEDRAREVQVQLIERGQHRAVSVPDLLIAATAEIEGLTVLHYDADFDLIAEITGQACEWIVPKGSISAAVSSISASPSGSRTSSPHTVSHRS